MEICTTTVSKPENQGLQFLLIGLQNQGERPYFFRFFSWKNVCSVKKFYSLSFYSKCRIAHILIIFFISTQTSKHKAKSFCNQ